MAILTSSSSFIVSLESKITVDLCLGKFLINIADSVFNLGGEVHILGIKVKVKNPYGVIIKNFPSGSSYDKSGSSLKSDVQVSFPKEFNTYLYGSYDVSVLITDTDNRSFTITKELLISEVDSRNISSNSRRLSGNITAIAKEGRVYIALDKPKAYSGLPSISQVNSLKLYFPTASAKPTLSFSSQNIKVSLFSGTYMVKGTSCVSYNLGDNVFISIPHVVEFSKELLLSINYECVFHKLSEISKLISCGSGRQFDETLRKVVKVLLLIETAKISSEEGRDPTEYISQLNDILGCDCHRVGSDDNQITPYHGKVRVDEYDDLDFLIDQLDVKTPDEISSNWSSTNGKATLTLSINYVALSAKLGSNGGGSGDPTPPSTSGNFFVSWSDSDPFIDDHTAPVFSSKGSGTIQSDGSILADFHSMPSQYFPIIKLPASARILNTWYDTPFNNGQIPDSVWRSPILIDGTDRYYIGRNPTDFDTTPNHTVLIS